MCLVSGRVPGHGSRLSADGWVQDEPEALRMVRGVVEHLGDPPVTPDTVVEPPRYCIHLLCLAG